MWTGGKKGDKGKGERKMRERQERVRRGKKPFIVDWVTWLLPSNCGVGDTWL